jgi:hypothetical protein
MLRATRAPQAPHGLRRPCFAWNHEPFIRGPTQNIPQSWSEITANYKSVSISQSSDLWNHNPIYKHKNNWFLGLENLNVWEIASCFGCHVISMSDGSLPNLVCRAACLVLKRRLWLNHLKPQCLTGELDHRFFVFKSNCLRLKPLIHFFIIASQLFWVQNPLPHVYGNHDNFGGGIHFSIFKFNFLVLYVCRSPCFFREKQLRFQGPPNKNPRRKVSTLGLHQLHPKPSSSCSKTSRILWLDFGIYIADGC